MHLLIATSSYPLRPDDAFAAAGLFVRDFAIEVARCGHHVTVLTHDRPGEIVADAEIEVVRHPAPGVAKALARLRVWHPLDVLKSIRLVAEGHRAMRDLIAQQEVDHVLAMWAFPAGLYALDARRRHAIPYTVWTLGSDIWSLARLPYFRQVIRRILRHADHCFADGLALGRATAALGGRPCDFLPSARHPRRGGLPPVAWPCPGFQLVFVGRLESNKGPDVLVEAAAILRDRGRDFGLTLFGDGTLRSAVEDLVTRRELRDRVAVRGFASPDTAQAYLQACDAAVIPSRIESIPVIFSDALRAAAPLVVTDVGDLGELVRRHDLGAVSPPSAPAALADAMERVMDADRGRWRANARRVAPSFSVSYAAATFLGAIGADDHRAASAEA